MEPLYIMDQAIGLFQKIHIDLDREIRQKIFWQNFIKVISIIFVICILVWITLSYIPKVTNANLYLAPWKDPGDTEMDVDMADRTFWNDPVDVDMRDISLEAMYFGIYYNSYAF